MEQSHRHLQHLLYRFLGGSRAETPQGSQLACAPGDLQPVSVPLQDGLRFFPPPYPHRLQLALRLSYLSCERSDTGLPRSTRLTRTGEVLSVRRERWLSMAEYYQDSVPAPVPFWRKPGSIFGLVLITTFTESSHLFAIPSIQPRLRLMLAETPPPHSSGASQ